MSRASRRRNRRLAGIPKPAKKQSPQSLFDSGEFKLAAEQLRLRIARTPSDDDRRLLAGCFLKLSQYEEATNQFQHLSVKTCRDFLRAGYCYIELKQWDNAIAQLLSAQQSEETAEGHYWLAVAIAQDEAWVSGERKSRVVAALSQAITLSNCRLHAYSWLVNLLENRHDSVSVLQKALAQFPDSAEIRLKLAQYALRDDLELARVSLQPLLNCPQPRFAVLWQSYLIESAARNLPAALHALKGMIARATCEKDRIILHCLTVDLALDFGLYDEVREMPLIELDKCDLEAAAIACLIAAKSHVALNQWKQAAKFLSAGLLKWQQTNTGCDTFDCLYASIQADDDEDETIVVEFSTDSQLLDMLDSKSVSASCKKLRSCLSYLRTREGTADDLRQLLDFQPYPIFHLDLSLRLADDGQLLDAIAAYLLYAVAMYSHPAFRWHQQFYEAEQITDGVATAKQGADIHQLIVKAVLANRGKIEFIETAIVPLYDKFWRELLLAGKMYKELEDVASFLVDSIESGKRFLFDKAYALAALGQPDAAEQAYWSLLDHIPEHSTASYNLSLLLEKRGDFVGSHSLLSDAVRLEPENDRWQQRLTTLNSKAEAQRVELEDKSLRHDEFLKTARERWPLVDYHKKRILSTLTVIRSYDDLNQLAALSGTGEQFIRGNMQKLLELGMLVEEENGKYSVNKYVVDLAKQERSHAVVTSIIRADSDCAVKPIFNSQLEYTCYNAILSLFPNNLVFPNMSLMSIFQYDRMQSLLDRETFGYFLRSQVDVCITSTANYLPLVAFEIDSPWHERAQQQARDAKKNDIFRIGGMPLLRLRPNGQPSTTAIRDCVIQAMRNLGKNLDDTQRAARSFFDLRAEIDFARFGLEELSLAQA